MCKQTGLVIEDLSKTFLVGEQKIEALKEINLTVNSGEFINIIGPSGCGKSTFLRCIADFEKPTSGRITLNGRQIKEPGIDRMMVFQSFDQLFPWYTIQRNIIFALDVADNSKKKKKNKTRQIIT